MFTKTKYNLLLGGLLVTALSTGACIFTSDTIDDPHPHPCPAIAPAPERNPATGECEIRDGWACDQSGPSMEQAPLGEPWAACYSACEELSDAACQETSGCQMAHFDPDGGYDLLGESPLACWAVIPGTSVTGDCFGLDAWSCATRDDCRPVYWPAGELTPASPDDGMEFSYCTAEHNANWPGDCYRDAICAMPPPSCPTGTLPGVGAGCWTGYCIPLEACEAAPACEGLGEATCLSRSDCDALYVACEPNEDCAYEFYGCITK